MLRSSYEEYLRRFNNRDYAGLLEYFAPEFEVCFAGVRLQGRDAVLRFYAFLHDYVRETILIERYVSDEQTVALEAIVRVEAIKDLTAQVLAEAGYPGLFPQAKGQVMEIPQFIHYHLRDGQFTQAVCALR